MKNKKCNRCHEIKIITKFSKNAATLDGFQYACKDCFNGLNRKHYRKNRKRIRKQRNTKKYKLNQSNYSIWYRGTINGVYSVYRYNAKKRKLEFSVTLEEFSLYYGKPCFYCGILAKGIDRIDNTVGYIVGNLVACCGKHNMMKGTLNQQQFINECELIVKHTLEASHENIGNERSAY